MAESEEIVGSGSSGGAGVGRRIAKETFSDLKEMLKEEMRKQKAAVATPGQLRFKAFVQNLAARGVRGEAYRAEIAAWRQRHQEA